jgi:hypothetical protein
MSRIAFDVLESVYLLQLVDNEARYKDFLAGLIRNVAHYGPSSLGAFTARTAVRRWESAFKNTAPDAWDIIIAAIPPAHSLELMVAPQPVAPGARASASAPARVLRHSSPFPQVGSVTEGPAAALGLSPSAAHDAGFTALHLLSSLPFPEGIVSMEPFGALYGPLAPLCSYTLTTENPGVVYDVTSLLTISRAILSPRACINGPNNPHGAPSVSDLTAAIASLGLPAGSTPNYDLGLYALCMRVLPSLASAMCLADTTVATSPAAKPTFASDAATLTRASTMMIYGLVLSRSTSCPSPRAPSFRTALLLHAWSVAGRAVLAARGSSMSDSGTALIGAEYMSLYVEANPLGDYGLGQADPLPAAVTAFRDAAPAAPPREKAKTPRPKPAPIAAPAPVPAENGSSPGGSRGIHAPPPPSPGPPRYNSAAYDALASTLEDWAPVSDRDWRTQLGLFDGRGIKLLFKDKICPRCAMGIGPPRSGNGQCPSPNMLHYPDVHAAHLLSDAGKDRVMNIPPDRLQEALRALPRLSQAREFPDPASCPLELRQ